MDFFRIFRRKAKREPKALRIDGVRTPLTPQPDEAEVAAQALLETMSKGESGRNGRDGSNGANGSDGPHDAAYYRELAEIIRKNRKEEARALRRYLAYCEEQIAQPLFTDGLGDIERDLCRFQDCAEREGGELLRRWQRCLAECIVRQMTASHTEDTEQTEGTEDRSAADAAEIEQIKPN